MARIKDFGLPKNQSVHFTDKALMELVRITAQIEDMSISEFTQLAVREFLSNPLRREMIARHKFLESLHK